jgi:hypothetical protein
MPTKNEGYVITSIVRLVDVMQSEFTSSAQNYVGGLFSGLLSVDSTRIVVYPTTYTPGSRRLTVFNSMEISIEVTSIPSFDIVNTTMPVIESYLQSAFFLDMSAYFSNLNSTNTILVTYAFVGTAAMNEGFSCSLTPDMTFSWVILDANRIQARLALNSDVNWLSFGLIRPAFFMFPDFIRHSVFIYAPKLKLGRYIMDGIAASDMIGDLTVRQYSGLVDANTAPGLSYFTVEYNTISESNDDPVLNPSGVNYITW